MNNIKTSTELKKMLNSNYKSNPKTKTIHFYSDPFFFLYIYFAHFIAFVLRIYKSFFSQNTPLLLKDETQLYIEKQTDFFLNVCFPSIDVLNDSSGNSDTIILEKKEKWNSNIDPRCYSADFLNNLFLEENNELELQWKRRLLHESTPRGNIIMYYDIYKQAFAYVSDQQMNYDILNACAMKYVRIYRCLDFFVDVNILPFDIISPFSLMLEENEKKEREKSIEKRKEMGIFFDSNAPFIKPKHITNNSSNMNPEIKSILKQKSVSFSNETDTPEYKKPLRDFHNVFRYLGKISNLSLLVKIIPVKKHPVLSVPIESFDYLSYKNMQKKNVEN